MLVILFFPFPMKIFVGYLAAGDRNDSLAETLLSIYLLFDQHMLLLSNRTKVPYQRKEAKKKMREEAEDMLKGEVV